MPHERFQGKTGLGLRGDSIVQFDWMVGEVAATLDRLNLAEKTLVVVCSDNGPVLDDGYKDGAVEKLGDHTPAGPFSGGKYSVLEGGTRTPFVTRWKGRITPGVSDQVVCTIDLPASAAALAGIELPAGACLDSFNVLGALIGEPGAKGRDHLVQQDNGGQNLGFRQGKWKLVRGKAAGKKGGGRLYDLDADPGEKQNVADRHPEIFSRLNAALDAALAGPTRPGASATPQ